MDGKNKFIKANCPSCGAGIDVDSTRDKLFCQYCGTKFVVNDVINPPQLAGVAEKYFEYKKERFAHKETMKRLQAEREQKKAEREERERQEEAEFMKKYGWWLSILAIAFVIMLYMNR